MNTSEVNEYCWRIPSFLGTFPSDLLPKITKLPSCLIYNNDPSDQDGSHWNGLYFFEDGTVAAFDSFGREPEIINYLSENSSNIVYSPLRLQAYDSRTCGLYAIAFIFLCHFNVEYCDILNLFNSNPIFNDQMIISLVNPFFEIKRFEK